MPGLRALQDHYVHWRLCRSAGRRGRGRGGSKCALHVVADAAEEGITLGPLRHIPGTENTAGHHITFPLMMQTSGGEGRGRRGSVGGGVKGKGRRGAGGGVR